MSGKGTWLFRRVRSSTIGRAFASAARNVGIGSWPPSRSWANAFHKMVRDVCFLPFIIIMLTKRSYSGSSK